MNTTRRVFLASNAVLIACSILMTLGSLSSLAQVQTSQALPSPGQIADVTCASDTTETYTLLLPTAYTSAKAWPIIYFFDPRGQGKHPVELYKQVAEQYGFILAGSNNSRNFGSEQAKAVNAVWQDTHARLTLDEHRSYASGFSGGARVAGAMGLSGPAGQIAAVIAHGAGYPSQWANSRNSLPYFFAVGDEDFNWPEVINIRREREEQGLPYRVRVFQGKHQWAPATTIEDAIQYINLKAMQAGHLPLDATFVEGVFQKLKAEAAEAEAQSDFIGELNAYRALVADFTGLRDVQEPAAKLTALQKSASLKSALKHEREQMAEQLKLEQEISPKIDSVATNSAQDTTALRLEIRQQMGALGDQAKHSKKEERRLICSRAFIGVFVRTMEQGQEELESRHFEQAEIYFDLMRQVSDDPWPSLSLADTHTSSGNRKLAIKDLNEAVRRGLKNRATIESDPRLQPLRGDPEFEKLLSGLNAK